MCQKCNKNVSKMCQNTKMWQITDKILTKNCQNPKCLQILSKVLQIYGKNVSKFKNVFKICQRQFHKSDKNLAKPIVVTVFCRIFAPDLKHFEETSSPNIWQNCDKTYFFDTFWTHFMSSKETFMKHFEAKLWQKSVNSQDFDTFLSQFCFPRPFLKHEGQQRPSMTLKMWQKSDKS